MVYYVLKVIVKSVSSYLFTFTSFGVLFEKLCVAISFLPNPDLRKKTYALSS